MLQAISDYKSRKKSIFEISNDLECGKNTVRMWIKSFDFQGETALVESNKKDFK
ncbi:MAG TPA: hypothetical protein PLR16_05495 [Bacilli bacterium]|nr:MAG: hypothetical protein BWY97_01072 [Tenericutes bacterium ADurb.BinA124]HPX84711.1 hypothetical protein [Bacilli bacterium]